MTKAEFLHAAGADLEAQRNCRAACAMTDAEGYTSVAEGMDPSSLVDFVNAYFRALFKAVLRNGGAVVDVKGDGILAIWTSKGPDVAMRTRVCRSCLQMIEATNRFGPSNPGNCLPTRIGVDFGPIALANVGAFARYEYRAVGDTVNTSSRLEQLNKELGTRILVSQPFAEGVEGFLFRDLGHFMLRGKRLRPRVLELVAGVEQATRRQRELCEAFAGALAALERGRIRDALLGFRVLCARYPDDGPSRYFLQRCIERKTRRVADGTGARAALFGFAPSMQFGASERGAA